MAHFIAVLDLFCKQLILANKGVGRENM